MKALDSQNQSNNESSFGESLRGSWHQKQELTSNNWFIEAENQDVEQETFNRNSFKKEPDYSKLRMMDSISPVFGGRQQNLSEQSNLSFILDKPIKLASLDSSVVISTESLKNDQNTEEWGQESNGAKLDDQSAQAE